MKKQTTSLSKKIKSYSALAASLAAVTGTADAQVVYTDIVDYTSTSNNDTYKLDLNNDGTNDFFIFTGTTSFSGLSFSSVGVTRAGSNQINRQGTGATSTSAVALNFNSNIGSGNVWSNTNNSNTAAMAAREINFNQVAGPWIGVTDKYLGLKLMNSGSTYYGWARLDVNKKANLFTIKDYAYNKKPDKPILAGDKGISTYAEENNVEGFSAYSYDKKLTVKLRESSSATLSIVNVLGQEIKSIITNDKLTRVDMTEFPAGVYFVTVTQGEATSTAKVFIQ